MRRLQPLLPLVLVLALVLGACGGEAPPAEPPAPPAQSPPPAGPPKPAPGAQRCPRAIDPSQEAPADTFDTGALVGLRERAARTRAARGGCRLRVIERDGEPLARTEDLRGDRVNVKVRDGVVTAVDGVY